MGCDIHLYVEALENGKWVSKDRWTQDEYADEGEVRMVVDSQNSFYNGRNYDLFAILADVRNGRGFAGADTGDGFNPICDPKGLPADVSSEVLSESNSWDADGHSHSFHTVADLMAFDWTQVAKKRGWVNGPEFASWDGYFRLRGLGPESYCGGVGGGGVSHASEQDMKRMIEDAVKDIPRGYVGQWHKALEPLCSTYTLVEWSTPYYRSASQFLGQTLPRLWRLGKPADVRIVFWFDN